ncbi:Phosphate-specific transport system accessory protein PhoU [Saliniradius amylolyticus]|uniref:Phosphate-specific transport system accessory protein PhoU n=1 Tax=Saliniradius amylolyticus TaxID=2183582 RepID=A0A2S2E0W1_9ALTE|nr:phosphate signaling complex protein PhoU [Saliniradius amylolyticus]AWL11274.1 Phosphate-specific transport system accessory protein PhoU [Saliniradius amylolyticus]
MDNIKLNTHISGRFNQELENLRNAVLTMGGVVEQQLCDAVVALRDNNAGLAEKVVVNDQTVNAMEVQIDEECLRIIAKRHPAASDLRLVMTINKVTADIERIGDDVERIAGLIVKRTLPVSADIKNGMVATGNQVMELFRQTLNAFARMDAEAALEIHMQDQDIDERYKQLLMQAVTEMQQERESMHQWLEILWAMRSLERVGDRCKNICEYVIYLVQGKDIRHASRHEIRDKLNELR